MICELHPTETGRVVSYEIDGDKATIFQDGLPVASIVFLGIGTCKAKKMAYNAALSLHLALGHAYRMRRKRKARIAALEGGAECAGKEER